MKTTSHIFKIFLDNNRSDEKLTIEELERIAAKYSAERIKNIEIKSDAVQSKPCVMAKDIVKSEIPFTEVSVTKKRRC